MMLEMLGSATTEENGATFIVGGIKNTSRRFGLVTVLFKLDHAPGVAADLPVASAYVYCREPGDIRQFKTEREKTPTTSS